MSYHRQRRAPKELFQHHFCNQKPRVMAWSVDRNAPSNDQSPDMERAHFHSRHRPEASTVTIGLHTSAALLIATSRYQFRLIVHRHEMCSRSMKRLSARNRLFLESVILLRHRFSIRVELNGIFLKKNGEFRRLPPDRTTSRPLCRQASLKHLNSGNLTSVPASEPADTRSKIADKLSKLACIGSKITCIGSEIACKRSRLAEK